MRLFEPKEAYYLDLVPSECIYATNQVELVAFARFPGHLLMRVTQLESELQPAGFDYDWPQKHLETNPKALAHHKEGDRIVLTAATRALLRFALKHLGEEELFEKPGVMVRKADRATQQDWTQSQSPPSVPARHDSKACYLGSAVSLDSTR